MKKFEMQRDASPTVRDRYSASNCEQLSWLALKIWLLTLDVFTIYYSRFTIHRPMNNEEIARRFNRMASMMEVRGEDPFRLRSYRMAAEAIETWPTEIDRKSTRLNSSH